MSALPASFSFFAAHEARLQWRGFTAMWNAKNPLRTAMVILFFALIGLAIAYIAFATLRPWAEAGIARDTTTFARITASGCFFAVLTLSQAIEQVTRAYYARGDLELILSAPAPSAHLFAARTGAIGASSALLTSLLVTPFVLVLAVLDSPGWLLTYPVIVLVSLNLTALAVFINLALFRLIGPRHTRLIAQILSGIVGASLFVGFQTSMLIGKGQVGGTTDALSSALAALAPARTSPFWLPARAALGDISALFILTAITAIVFALALAVSAKSFAALAIAAGTIPVRRPAAITNVARPFRPRTPAAQLRLKELRLLWRDPWLLSQTLTQLLYLLPLAFVIFFKFGQFQVVLPLSAALVTMAAGQLSGGLAWLAISGEDAPDLIATAPLPAFGLYRGKIEAVTIAVALLLLPLLAGIAMLDLATALIAALGAFIACLSSIFVQIMFRTRARRNQFARRQGASKFATLTEALASVCWAGAAGLAVANPIIGLIGTLPALLILAIVWLTRRNIEPA